MSPSNISGAYGRVGLVAVVARWCIRNRCWACTSLPWSSGFDSGIVEVSFGRRRFGHSCRARPSVYNGSWCGDCSQACCIVPEQVNTDKDNDTVPGLLVHIATRAKCAVHTDLDSHILKRKTIRIHGLNVPACATNAA